jgi:enamine deaminase RidA (YjgF/YER057c/UK114 family)
MRDHPRRLQRNPGLRDRTRRSVRSLHPGCEEAPAFTVVEVSKMTSLDYLIEINAITVVADRR